MLYTDPDKGQNQHETMGMKRKIAVIGLGYVGAPVAVAFARNGFETIGFDIDAQRIAELRSGLDRTGELEGSVTLPGLTYSDHPEDLKKADFYIVTVPTPVDRSRRPDLRPLKSASETIGHVLSKGDIVVYESTVYPGATEEECIPVLENVSGLVHGVDFKTGYSPERINPGDKTNRFETITKVVSGSDAESLDIIAETYATVIKAGIHRAPNMKTAEAAKAIENTQRDINIAFVNELSQFFDRVGIDTMDVLEAAGTKWNFLPFTPGLVGGHCIGIDPYYLTFKAEELAFHPEVILSGRRVNDEMGRVIANQAIKLLLKKSGADKRTVTILGLSFKENVPDLRNSRVFDILNELKSIGVEVQVSDCMADPDEARREYGIDLVPLEQLKPSELVILAVPHKEYCEGGWKLISRLLKQNGAVMDIKSVLNRSDRPDSVLLWRL